MGMEGDDTVATLAGILHAAAPYALHRSAVSLVQGTRPTMRENLFQMKIPRTFIFWRAVIFGEQSLPDPDWDALPQKGIRVLSVPNAGHGMPWDNPTGVAEALSTAMAV